ncbi:MAG TPA: hypothetical protein DDW78_01680 [Treponema sp.]|nr:hypothetical protein [Treponema sp.]
MQKHSLLSLLIQKEQFPDSAIYYTILLRFLHQLPRKSFFEQQKDELPAPPRHAHAFRAAAAFPAHRRQKPRPITPVPARPPFARTALRALKKNVPPPPRKKFLRNMRKTRSR